MFLFNFKVQKKREDLLLLLIYFNLKPSKITHTYVDVWFIKKKKKKKGKREK